MSFTRFAANLTAVGHSAAHTVPFSNQYLVTVSMPNSVSTQVNVELTSDGTNWWTPSSLTPISSGTDVLVYQLTNMPALQMRLNVTSIDPGVTVDGYVGNL